MNKKLTISILSLFGVFIVLLVGYFVWLFKNSTNGLQSEIIELDSVYISDENNIAQLQLALEKQTDIEEDFNPTKSGELATNENRKVITFDNTLSQEEIDRIEEEYNVEFTQDQSVRGTYSVLVNETSKVQELSKEENIDNIETDIPIKMFGETIDWGIVRVGASKVWDSGSGSGILIGIIDTGIQIDHPDLANNIVGGYDFVNNDSNASDDNGHGTHVAGIVASSMNGVGSVGASYSARLMPIKVLNESGYGYLSDVAKGIYYAADNGVRIINMSLGTSYDSDTLRKAIEYAVNKGVLIVAAAGNDYGSPCSYPAAYSSVICVVATDQDNKLAGFSNVGGELAAPGVSNYSTYINSSYAKLSGTSMASPHIAGSAALIMSLCTDCSTSEIRDILRSSATDLGSIDYDIIFGYGLVNLIDAVESILPDEVTEETPVENGYETPDETDEPLDEGNESVQEDPSDDRSEENNGVDDEIRNRYKEPNLPTPTPEFTLEIVSPSTNPSNRYMPRTREDIEIVFDLSPSSTNSTFSIYLNNEEIEGYDGISTSYTLSIDDLKDIQYMLRVEADLGNGLVLNDSILLDLTRLTRGQSSRSVRGISDFRNWFIRLLFIN